MERAETPPAVPKLAIWHFLLWMTCIAAIAAANGVPSGAVQEPWQLAAGLSYLMIAGLALVGLVMAIGCALLRRSYFPVSAGHWLLTTGGLIVILSEASNRITDAWFRSSGGGHQIDYAQPVMMGSFALMAAVNLATAWFVKDSWPWRLVFVGYAALGLFWSITNTILTYGDKSLGYQWDRFGQHVQWPWQWFLLVAILVLSAIDLKRRRPRDWLHWTGIGYVAAWVVSQGAVTLLHRLAAP